MAEINKWWGMFDFALDDVKTWQLGERFISIKRSNHEWTIWDKTTPVEENEPILLTSNHPEHDLSKANCSRVLVTKTGDSLLVEASLADRPMIIRPSKPFVVLPQETVNIYVSTPVWFTVLLSDRDLPVIDIPFWRPSDTWFGPSTMHGDLCYAKYTDAKMEKAQLLKRSHRASTLVTIKNAHAERLVIERLSLPVPAFKLYVNDSGEFWTDQLSITQSVEHTKPVSHVKQSKPADWQNMSVVSESRELSTKASFLSSIKNFIA